MEGRVPSMIVILQWYVRVVGLLCILGGVMVILWALIWEVESKYLIRVVAISLIPFSLGILHYFVARGLGNLKNWSKNFLIGWCVLNILFLIWFSVYQNRGFFGNLIPLGIFIGIIYYLIKNRRLFS